MNSHTGLPLKMDTTDLQGLPLTLKGVQEGPVEAQEEQSALAQQSLV